MGTVASFPDLQRLSYARTRPAPLLSVPPPPPPPNTLEPGRRRSRTRQRLVPGERAQTLVYTVAMAAESAAEAAAAVGGLKRAMRHCYPLGE